MSDTEPKPGLIRRAFNGYRKLVGLPEVRADGALANPGVPITGSVLGDLLGATDSSAGVRVTSELAIRNSFVLSCVRVIAESIAVLPAKVYRYDATNDVKTPNPNHPLWSLLTTQPVPEITAFQWFEMMQAWLCLRGNAFAVIESNAAGKVTGLWPVRPERMFVYLRIEEDEFGHSGGPRYVWTPYGQQARILPAADVLHIKALSPDGILGYNPIELMRESVGSAVATERYSSKVFANGGAPGGVLSHPGHLDDKAYALLKSSWNEAHRGFDNAARVAILEEGIQWQSTSLPPEDMQFLQTRQFQLEDICRLYRISPEAVNAIKFSRAPDSDNTALNLMRFTLQPWLVRWEQELQRQLLATNSGHIVRFDTKAALRGDVAGKITYYNAGASGGWLSRNEIRRMEDLNPIDKPGMDDYFVPMNMVPTDDIEKQPYVNPALAGPPSTPLDGQGTPDPKGGAPDLPGKTTQPPVVKGKDDTAEDDEIGQ